MNYKKIKPFKDLEPFIHFYWELKGNDSEKQWERVFPDGCAGIVLNLREACMTDNGSAFLQFGKTYIVGAMNTFKDSFIGADTHLMGVCLKPGTFTNFYCESPQNVLTNSSVEFEKSSSFDIDKIFENSFDYFNRFFIERRKNKHNPLQPIIEDVQKVKGQTSIYDLAKRNFTTVRQLERDFKKMIGLSPKEFSNIIRFQNALHLIRNSGGCRSLLDISIECGYYDHAHLTNEIRRNTGLSPSLL